MVAGEFLNHLLIAARYGVQFVCTLFVVVVGFCFFGLRAKVYADERLGGGTRFRVRRDNV